MVNPFLSALHHTCSQKFLVEALCNRVIIVRSEIVKICVAKHLGNEIGRFLGQTRRHDGVAYPFDLVLIVLELRKIGLCNATGDLLVAVICFEETRIMESSCSTKYNKIVAVYLFRC